MCGPHPTTYSPKARSSASFRRSRPSAPGPGPPLTNEDARRIVHRFLEYYNDVRFHSAIDYISAIGYITPADILAGRAAIHA